MMMMAVDRSKQKKIAKLGENETVAPVAAKCAERYVNGVTATAATATPTTSL